MLNGKTAYREETIKKIRGIIEAHGIEFTELDGVRRRSEGVQILQGPNDFRAFYGILYNHLSIYGGDICISGVDEALFSKYQTMGEPDFTKMNVARLSELTNKRGDITYKILVREGDTNFVASSYASYRWQSRKSFSPTAFYVFGDYLGLISFQGENAPKIILIHSAPFADAYRKQFLEDWERAQVPAAKLGNV